MKDTYLTIDLDYWNGRELDIDWLAKVVSLKEVPKYVVDHHHHIIPHINSVPVNRVVNVDYHSDICEDAECTGLECGTWGNYVKWANKGMFLWIYPYDDCVSGYFKRDRSPEGKFVSLSGYGTCHLKDSPFSKNKQYTKWKIGKCVRRMETRPSIDLKRVAYVAFCTSPDYSECHLKEPWYKFINNFKIPYITTSKESILPELSDILKKLNK